MAEKDSAQERTEEASQKKLGDARNKGDVPRSRELNTVAMLIASLVGLLIFGRDSVLAYREMAAGRFDLERADLFGDEALLNGFHDPLMSCIWIAAPFLCVMFLSTLIGPLFMSGWMLTFSSLKIEASKLSPLAGLKRMVGIQGLVELLKAVAKVVLLGSIGVFAMKAQLDDYLSLGDMPISDAVAKAFGLLFVLGISMIVAMILIAALDVPYQRWSHAKKLRMTKQEVREESKETNGNPEVKAKVRQLQQSVAQRRMLLDVPTADVIVVNPTHYSVALRYSDGESAPVVVAKGVDHMAMRIREIAGHSKIPTFSAPELTRALYRHAEVGNSIPTELYLAVAQVLAYVFQFKQASDKDRSRMITPSHLPVPPSMRDPE